jgi:hypothetical protein
MLGLVGLYFGLTLVVFAVTGGGNRILAKLSDHGRPTTGIVRSIRLGRSWWVIVEFEADGEKRSIQSRFLGKPNPRLSELRVGQPVAMWYLPEDPSAASIGNPRWLRRRDSTAAIATVVGFLLWIGVLRAWASLRLTRRRAPPRSSCSDLP